MCGGKKKISNSGSISFVCEDCSRKFTSRSNLRRHVRTHTGEKPFMCEVCKRRFTQSNNLYAHRKQVHGLFNRNGVQKKESPKKQRSMRIVPQKKVSPVPSSDSEFESESESDSDSDSYQQSTDDQVEEHTVPVFTGVHSENSKKLSEFSYKLFTQFSNNRQCMTCGLSFTPPVLCDITTIVCPPCAYLYEGPPVQENWNQALPSLLIEEFELNSFAYCVQEEDFVDIIN